MNYIDLIIIYLACGAPFGVYYFFENRTKSNHLFVRAMLISLVWIIYAFTLLHTNITEKLNNKNCYIKNKRVYDLQKFFESNINQHSQVSLYELRETFERYIELTNLVCEKNDIPAKHEQEFFRISGATNKDLASICLHRQNQNKLFNHQCIAREDFIETVKHLSQNTDNKIHLIEKSFELVSLLNDLQAQKMINNLIETDSQTNEPNTVNQWETEICKPIKLQQKKENSVTMPLQPIKMTISERKRD